MSYGASGLLATVKKALVDEKLNTITPLPVDLERRGLADLSVLPVYYARNDALLVYDAVRKYVSDYVSIYYTTTDVLLGDFELQAWVKELATAESEGGMGVSELPGGGQLKVIQDLVDLVTSVIYTCSAAHASANNPQYDESFPPNYPMTLYGSPPASSSVVKTDQDILAALPDMETAMNNIIPLHGLSQQRANSLGDFETDYVYDPPAVRVVEGFREELRLVSGQIRERNLHRDPPYETMLPENIANSISV